MLTFNAVAGEQFTRQVGVYRVCRSMVSQDIAGIIESGDGSVSPADYRDYLHRDNGKMYGTDTLAAVFTRPRRLWQTPEAALHDAAILVLIDTLGKSGRSAVEAAPGSAISLQRYRFLRLGRTGRQH